MCNLFCNASTIAMLYDYFFMTMVAYLESIAEIEQCYFLSPYSPFIYVLVSYLRLLKEQSGYPTECNIIALIYTNRMTSMGCMSLTMENWRAVWAVTVILAQKMWDDTPLKTSAFAHILPSFSKQLLRNLELSALTVLQFSTGKSTSHTFFSVCKILIFIFLNYLVIRYYSASRFILNSTFVSQVSNHLYTPNITLSYEHYSSKYTVRTWGHPCGRSSRCLL